MEACCPASAAQSSVCRPVGQPQPRGWACAAGRRPPTSKPERSGVKASYTPALPVCSSSSDDDALESRNAWDGTRGRSGVYTRIATLFLPQVSSKLSAGNATSLTGRQSSTAPAVCATETVLKSLLCVPSMRAWKATCTCSAISGAKRHNTVDAAFQRYGACTPKQQECTHSMCDDVDANDAEEGLLRADVCREGQNYFAAMHGQRGTSHTRRSRRNGCSRPPRPHASKATKNTDEELQHARHANRRAELTAPCRHGHVVLYSRRKSLLHITRPRIPPIPHWVSPLHTS